jgi:hypothetical protein
MWTQSLETKDKKGYSTKHEHIGQTIGKSTGHRTPGPHLCGLTERYNSHGFPGACRIDHVAHITQDRCVPKQHHTTTRVSGNGSPPDCSQCDTHEDSHTCHENPYWFYPLEGGDKLAPIEPHDKHCQDNKRYTDACERNYSSLGISW